MTIYSAVTRRRASRTAQIMVALGYHDIHTHRGTKGLLHVEGYSLPYGERGEHAAYVDPDLCCACGPRAVLWRTEWVLGTSAEEYERTVGGDGEMTDTSASTEQDARLMREARVDQAFERAHMALEMAARLIVACADSYATDCEEGEAACELTAPLRQALDVLDVAELNAEEEWWEGQNESQLQTRAGDLRRASKAEALGPSPISGA